MIFSPGKLLLTSEYVVLDGALALAVPTRWGQEFFVSAQQDDRSLVYWQARHENQPWLEAVIDYRQENVVSTNIPEAAAFVLRLLVYIKQNSALRLQETASYHITTNLQFPAHFGLGSSSTLMNNLAQWAAIDAFQLNENCLGGSGYDVAVAQHQSPILFQTKPARLVEEVRFNPAFKDELIFIHLNQKQDSREGIALYRKQKKSQEVIETFSEITRKVLKASQLSEFSVLMEKHERELSALLGLPTVKEKLFPDCPTFVKSLGAWGGDFVMSARFPKDKDYFQQKGFSTIFTYDEIIADGFV